MLNKWFTDNNPLILIVFHSLALNYYTFGEGEDHNS